MELKMIPFTFILFYVMEEREVVIMHKIWR